MKALTDKPWNTSIHPDWQYLPLLPGHRVRIRELQAIEFNDGGAPRRWFHISIDGVFTGVVIGGYIPFGKMLCGDHGMDECEHKEVVRKFMDSER